MTLPITKNTREAALQRNLTPNLVLEIDGVTTKYGAVPILRYIRIGDDDLLIGGGWHIGGLSPLKDQLDNISFDGSSTSVSQNLNQDKSASTTVPSMSVALVDLDLKMTELISPGIVVPDLLGRKCIIWLGFSSTAWKEDYLPIHRGTIDQISSEAGKIVLSIAHPDSKKRQTVFIKSEAKLTGSINNSVTSITVDNASQFLTPVLGPNGLQDPSFIFAVRIEDEVIRYTNVSGNTLTGCTRGYLNTAANAHASGTNVDSFYRLTGNAMDLAQKVMISTSGYFKTGVKQKAFNQISPSETVPNSLFFYDENIADTYGLTIGDYVTTTGAANGANNVTLKQITAIVKTDTGVYLEIDGVSFIDESDGPGVVSFRSQYDTLPDGCAMSPEEVDCAEHQRIKRLFLSSFEYDFYLRDSIDDGKAFIEEQMYFPAASYAVPRKARSSVGYHIGPIPGLDVLKLSTSNISNASKLKLNRNINKNFYNTIIYKFEQDVLDEKKYLDGEVTISGDSESRINIGTRALVVQSDGMRSFLSGQNNAQQQSNRRLNRYKFGAEYIDSIEVFFGSSFKVEIGDIVILDNSELQVSDTRTGKRSGTPKFFEVVNKSLDIKTGKVKVNIVDTNFATQARYCLISPSSKVFSGSTTSQFKIYEFWPSPFGTNEGAKWSRFDKPSIRIRSPDWSRNDLAVIDSVSGNTITLASPISFVPQFGDIVELTKYDQSTDELHLLYGWMRNINPFADGTNRYQML